MIENQPPIPTGDKGDESDESDEDHFSTLAEVIWSVLPLTVLFNEESGDCLIRLKLMIRTNPPGRGAKPALNFLQIAEIDLPTVLKGARRAL